MRKFKVLKCKQTKMVEERKSFRNGDGTMSAYVSYREVKAGEDGWYPGAYGVEKIKEGDIIELEGDLADKCANNPHFEEVFEAPKKKVGRPKKVA